MKGNDLQNSQSSILKRIYSRWPIVMVIVLPFIALGALIYLYNIGMKISVRSEPLLHASAKVQLELSLFHLWFEEFIDRDPSITEESVWKYLKNAERYVDVMLDGGVVPEGRVLPIEDPRLHTLIERSKATIRKLARVAEVRMKNPGESLAGTDIDQRFDSIFLEVLEHTNEVERKIATNISEQYARYRFITIILGGGIIVITVLVIGAFLRFDRQRLQAEREIRKSHDELENRIEERTHHLEIEIGERKQAEQAVRDSERRLRSVLDNIIDGIVTINERDTVEFFSPSAERIFGYRAEEVVGRNVNMLMPEPYHGEHDTYIANYLETGEAKVIGIGREVMGRRKDGSTFPMGLGVSEVYLEGHRLFTGIVQDITKRKHAEEELRQARNNLEKRVEERTRELSDEIAERKQAQAQVIQAAKLATLGEMATSVAHELNQPLNVIRMAAGNVLRKLEKGKADPTYLNDKLERIASQTERAAAIIDHMRMFGRKADEKPQKLDPCDAVKGALDLMGEQLRLAEINVSLDLPEAPSSVLGHSVQIEQVILNLLTNARDAVIASGNEKKIALAVSSDDEGIRITVSDSGGGIPENALDRIFEPFYTTKEMGKGTGLGLSVSYGIIRDMGGTIEAANVDGGAKFTITLPAA